MISVRSLKFSEQREHINNNRSEKHAEIQQLFEQIKAEKNRELSKLQGHEGATEAAEGHQTQEAKSHKTLSHSSSSPSTVSFLAPFAVPKRVQVVIHEKKERHEEILRRVNSNEAGNNDNNNTGSSTSSSAAASASAFSSFATSAPHFATPEIVDSVIRERAKKTKRNENRGIWSPLGVPFQTRGELELDFNLAPNANAAAPPPAAAPSLATSASVSTPSLTVFTNAKKARAVPKDAGEGRQRVEHLIELFRQRKMSLNQGGKQSAAPSNDAGHGQSGSGSSAVNTGRSGTRGRPMSRRFSQSSTARTSSHHSHSHSQSDSFFGDSSASGSSAAPQSAASRLPNLVELSAISTAGLKQKAQHSRLSQRRLSIGSAVLNPYIRPDEAAPIVEMEKRSLNSAAAAAAAAAEFAMMNGGDSESAGHDAYGSGGGEELRSYHAPDSVSGVDSGIGYSRQNSRRVSQISMDNIHSNSGLQRPMSTNSIHSNSSAPGLQRKNSVSVITPASLLSSVAQKGRRKSISSSMTMARAFSTLLTAQSSSNALKPPRNPLKHATKTGSTAHLHEKQLKSLKQQAKSVENLDVTRFQKVKQWKSEFFALKSGLDERLKEQLKVRTQVKERIQRDPVKMERLLGELSIKRGEYGISRGKSQKSIWAYGGGSKGGDNEMENENNNNNSSGYRMESKEMDDREEKEQKTSAAAELEDRMEMDGLQRDLDAGIGYDVNSLSSFALAGSKSGDLAAESAIGLRPPGSPAKSPSQRRLHTPSSVDSAILSRFRSMEEVNTFAGIGSPSGANKSNHPAPSILKSPTSSRRF